MISAANSKCRWWEILDQDIDSLFANTVHTGEKMLEEQGFLRGDLNPRIQLEQAKSYTTKAMHICNGQTIFNEWKCTIFAMPKMIIASSVDEGSHIVAHSNCHSLFMHVTQAKGCIHLSSTPVCLGVSLRGVLLRGLPPRVAASASLRSTSPTAEVYISVKSVSIFKAMHCTKTACSSALSP